MPFPTDEQVRAAVEKQLHDGLADMPGDWIATLADGGELEFRMGLDGSIHIEYSLDDAELETLPDDQPAEKLYKFRVAVVPA